MDWTKISTDPNDRAAMSAVHDHLLGIRSIKKFEYVDWVVSLVRGLDCLDIGAVEHDLSYADKETWKHRRLVNSAKRVVGIDIIDEYVTALNERGYDIRLCDATSDVYLGEKYDIVVAGDVLEHVVNPGALLQFALRHLKEGGGGDYQNT